MQARETKLFVGANVAGEELEPALMRLPLIVADSANARIGVRLDSSIAAVGIYTTTTTALREVVCGHFDASTMLCNMRRHIDLERQLAQRRNERIPLRTHRPFAADAIEFASNARLRMREHFLAIMH